MGLFVECDICRPKPGTPIICGACYHNRTNIEVMQSLFRKVLAANVLSDDRFLPYSLKEQIQRVVNADIRSFVEPKASIDSSAKGSDLVLETDSEE